MPHRIAPLHKLNYIARRTLPPLLAACCVFAGCSRNSGPPVTVGEITDYCINPSRAKFEALASRPADTAALNEGLRTLRASSPPGVFREWLTDTAGSRYCVGYRTPVAIRTDTLYPLIIYLHGGIGTQRDDKGDSAFLMLEALADTFDLFLASPSANRYAPWWSGAGIARILQTLRFLAARYPLDGRKVFLAGVSDGATGCYAAANTIGSPFAGFIAVSGFGGMLPALGMPLVPGNLRQRPIYNVNAGRDRLYPADTVQRFVDALRELGVPVTMKIYPEEEHGFDYRDKEMGTLASLIRTWSRPETACLSWTIVPGFPNRADNLLDWTAAGDEASVRSFWRGDSLIVDVRGFSSITTAFPPTQQKGKITCIFASDGDKRRTCVPLKIDWPLALRLMLHRCHPGFAGARCYMIKP